MAYYFNILLYAWYIVFFILIVLLYVKNSMEYNSDFKSKQVETMPKFSGPHLLSFLLYKKITPNVFISTVLILIKKGAITAKETKDGVIFINTSENMKLSSAQKYLIDILFNNIADKDFLTINDIVEYSQNNNKCSMFLIDLQIWKRIMYKEISSNDYYEPKKTYSLIKWYRNLTFIILILNYVLKVNSFNGYFIIAPAYFLMVSFYYVYKRTRSANDEYYKWLSFKKHLSTKETSPDYLIQAIVLNVSKPYVEVSNQKETLSYQLHLAFSKLIRRSILYGNRSLNANRDKWY